MNPASGAADITVPSTPRPIAIDVALHRIRQLLDACGTSNRHDLAIVAIEALIEEGVNTGPAIIGAARSLGFKASHAGAIGEERGRQRGPSPVAARSGWRVSPARSTRCLLTYRLAPRIGSAGARSRGGRGMISTAIF